MTHLLSIYVKQCGTVWWNLTNSGDMYCQLLIKRNLNLLLVCIRAQFLYVLWMMFEHIIGAIELNFDDLNYENLNTHAYICLY